MAKDNLRGRGNNSANTTGVENSRNLSQAAGSINAYQIETFLVLNSRRQRLTRLWRCILLQSLQSLDNQSHHY